MGPVPVIHRHPTLTTPEELDELMGDPRPSDEDLLGLTATEFGKGFLGTQAMTGRVLLSAFGAGSVADSMEDIQNKGGVLPEWASKHITVQGPDIVMLDTGADKPIVLSTVHKLSIYGGSRNEGNGYEKGKKGSFSFSVDSPVRIEMKVKDPKFPAAEPKLESRTDVKKLMVFGGEESGTLEKSGSSGGGGMNITSAFGGGGKKSDEKKPDDKKSDNLKTKVQGKGSDEMGHDIDSIIGELGYTEIVGDDGWVEIVGDSFSHGTAVLGAAPPRRVPPRAGFVGRTTPNGNKVLSLTPGKVKKGDHLASIKNAADVGKRAVSIGTRLQQALNRPTTRVRGDEVLGADFEVLGDDFEVLGDDVMGTDRDSDYEVLGAAPKAKPKLAPKKGKKRILTRAEIKKIADATVASGKKLLATADKYAKLVDTNEAKKQKGIEKAKKQTSKVKVSSNVKAIKAQAGKTSTVRPSAAPVAARTAARPGAAPVMQRSVVRGDEVMGADFEVLGDEILGAGFEVLGDFEIMGLEAQAEALGLELHHMVQDEIVGYDPTNPPDPQNPGYLMDGTSDPDATSGAAGGFDPFATTASDPTIDPYADPGAPPMPTLATVQAALANPQTAAEQFNFTYQADPAPDGVDWSSYPVLPPGAIMFQGNPALDQSDEAGAGSLNRFTIEDSAVKNSPRGKNPVAKVLGGEDSGFQLNKDGWQTYDHGSGGSGYSSPNAREMIDLSKASMDNGWGPIVGRPGTAASGLRMLAGSNPPQFFWFFDKAPSFARTAKEQEILQQALLDYQTLLTAYKADVAAKAAADQLDREQAAAIAKQNALEAQQQQHQIEMDQAAAESLASQQAVIDAQMQASQTAYDQQQAALMTQMDQAAAALEQQQYQAQTDIDLKAYEQLLATEQKYPAPAPQYAEEGGYSDGYGASGDPVADEMYNDMDSSDAQMYASDEATAREMDEM